MKERAREQRFWLVKFVAAFILSFPVFLLAMVFENIPATDRPLQTNADGFTAVALTKWALVTPVQVHSLSKVPLYSCWLKALGCKAKGHADEVSLCSLL